MRIENRNGRISIRTHDQPAIVIDVAAELYADSSSEADSEAARIERGISQEGNRVTAIAPELPRPEWFFFGRGPKVDYEILVPGDTEVRASSRNGSVTLVATRRKARIDCRNGRVSVENVEADIEIESRNGRVTIAGCGGAAKVSGVNGPITLEKVRGPVEVETRNGPIELVNPGSTVRASTTNGPLKYTGRVNGDVDLRASNGSVRFAVPADSRFEIDAESVRGSTRSDLPVRERSAAEAAGPAPKVKIRTVNGAIRVTEA